MNVLVRGTDGLVVGCDDLILQRENHFKFLTIELDLTAVVCWLHYVISETQDCSNSV